VRCKPLSIYLQTDYPDLSAFSWLFQFDLLCEERLNTCSRASVAQIERQRNSGWAFEPIDRSRLSLRSTRATSNQLQPLQTRVPFFADDDVVVHRNAERCRHGDDLLRHLDVRT
jgi:hypothetical protein